MNKNQIVGIGLCGCFLCYVSMETMGRIEPKQYHEPHVANNLGLIYNGSASATATASMASGSTISFYNQGTLYKLG